MNIIEAYNENVRQINKDLKIVKKGGAAYDEFLRKITGTLEKLEGAFYFYSNQRAELVKEKEKKDEFMASLKKYLVDQNSKLQKKAEAVESFTNMARTTLTSMKFKTLGKIKQNDAVENLFQFLYVNLYNEKESTFNYSNFSKFALNKEIADFQKRLATFSVAKLSPESRERLAQIKSNDYSANQNNEDLYYLLEWLEYNYEAFLALKDKEQSIKVIKETQDKEKKYNVQIKSSALILTDIEDILQYIDINLAHLKLYKRKFEEANEMFRRTPQHQAISQKMVNLFHRVDGFKGNEVVTAIDFELNQ